MAAARRIPYRPAPTAARARPGRPAQLHAPARPPRRCLPVSPRHASTRPVVTTAAFGGGNDGPGGGGSGVRGFVLGALASAALAYALFAPGPATPDLVRPTFAPAAVPAVPVSLDMVVRVVVFLSGGWWAGCAVVVGSGRAGPWPSPHFHFTTTTPRKTGQPHSPPPPRRTRIWRRMSWPRCACSRKRRRAWSTLPILRISGSVTAWTPRPCPRARGRALYGTARYRDEGGRWGGVGVLAQSALPSKTFERRRRIRKPSNADTGILINPETTPTRVTL